MLIDFNKPKRIMTEDERRDKYSSDSGVAGTYVSNMSKEDMYKWKGKHITGENERIEIRKTISGTQVLIIIYKNEKIEEKTLEYSKKKYQVVKNKNVHISANGKIIMNFEEYDELKAVVEEAKELLNINDENE